MRKLALCVTALLVLAGRAPAQAQPQDRRLQNDLKQIGLAYHNYFDANRKAPAKAEDLAPYLENDKRLVNLLKNDIVFGYNVGIRDMKDGTSNTVLAYLKDVPTKGGYALYGDGAVKRLTADQFKKAIIAKKK
jgi:hypothetical protein